MNPSTHFPLKRLTRALIPALALMATAPAYAGLLSLATAPLFLTSSSRANVLMLYGNSNSMDEDETGGAAPADSNGYTGSQSDKSKSQIARTAISTLISSYTGSINMGLMAYQQNSQGLYYLANSQYDASYNPADYNPGWTGARADPHNKKYRVANPSSPGDYIYYNVQLPFYSNGPIGYNFCYSTTACAGYPYGGAGPFNDFKGYGGSCQSVESPTGGPWDNYACYQTKIGSSNAAPGQSGAGYSGFQYSSSFYPTDSDLGQGITDFGRNLPSQQVGRAWFANTSPGMGYVHVPLALLDATQAAKLNTKLGRTQFSSNQPTNASYPLQNAGLTALEGSVLTANNYFNSYATVPSSQGGPLPAPPNSCNKNFLIMLSDGFPSVDKSGNTISPTGIPAALTNLQTQVSALYNSNAKAETYVVGLAILPTFNANPHQLDAIAAAGNTTQAYFAHDTSTLVSQFQTIFNDILSKTAAASAVALNSQSISVNSRVFQARFNSQNWSGQLLSLPINADGSLGSAVWDAGAQLASPDPTQRVIVTYKPSAGRGIPFEWPANAATPSSTELDPSQVTALNKTPAGGTDSNGSARLAYLRGDGSNEQPNGALGFRIRPTSKLGDIVDSAPIFVGIPGFNYDEGTYGSFRGSMQNRTPMIYVGANDGMLHGFNANNGKEVFAYVPSGVYNNLTQLTNPTYSHLNYVDGTPYAADVQVGGSWRTILASPMGAGARGIFALDVTDPSSFTEANAANIVKWEFTDANDPDVGYIFDAPNIVKLNNGSWAAIFGNGYNSTGSGNSVVFVVDISTGTVLKKFSTGVGSAGTPNAMANPLVIDVDGNGTADLIYAGDLQGNLWKIDISSSDPSGWTLSYKLFTQSQPITTMPDAGKHPLGGYLVYFGTGKYLELGDIGSTNQNTIYAIWDHGAGNVDATKLLQQTVVSTQTINGATYRIDSQNPINWATNTGWYVNLPTTGERVVTDPVLHNGRVIFTSMIPSTAACSYGGVSWLMELDWLTGGMPSTPTFDTNGDGVVNGSDTPTAGAAMSSIASSPAIQYSPSIAGTELKYINMSSGQVSNMKEKGGNLANRRISWRQLQ